MKQKDLAVGLAVGMTCGLVLGAVAAALLTPASGAEARRRLRFERDNAVEAARLQARRAMARLSRERPEGEGEEEGREGVEEEEVAFTGA